MRYKKAWQIVTNSSKNASQYYKQGHSKDTTKIVTPWSGGRFLLWIRERGYPEASGREKEKKKEEEGRSRSRLDISRTICKGRVAENSKRE